MVKHESARTRTRKHISEMAQSVIPRVARLDGQSHMKFDSHLIDAELTVCTHLIRVGQRVVFSTLDVHFEMWR